MAKKRRYYAFLDIVVDVFYSIILYNLFATWLGFADLPATILFAFMFVVVIDYWWAERTVEEIPKYCLTDIYFYTFIFFVLSQIPGHFNDPRAFVLWFMAFIALDLMFSLVDRAVYKVEKAGRKFLNAFIVSYVVLLVVYGLEACFLESPGVVASVLIAAPYLCYIVYLLAARYTETKAVYFEG
jgi:hypothetical protein